MITKFRLLETYLIGSADRSEPDIGVSWVTFDIKEILQSYFMFVTLESDCNKLHYRKYTSKGQSIIESEATIDGWDLSALLAAITDLHLKERALSLDDLVNLLDEICEYYITKLNPLLFSKLQIYMSNKLIKKLENDPKYGHIITSNKFGL